MENSINVYYKESPTTEKCIDVVVENSRIYKRYYSKRNFKSNVDINNFIYHIVVKEGFVLDKSNSDCSEFVDIKTGLIRYIFWFNNSVEKLYFEEIGNINIDDNSMFF